MLTYKSYDMMLLFYHNMYNSMLIFNNDGMVVFNNDGILIVYYVDIHHDMLAFIWYVDIQCMMICSYLIIQGILINGMLTSKQT